jgi:hypothetical protein
MLKLANPTLATARKNHLDWRERIKDYFLGLTDKDPDFVDHTQCLLGKWIYSSSEVEIKSLGTFVELEAHHKVMHETVPAIVEAKKSRNPKVFESEFRRFHTLADLVVSKIEMLDLEIQKIEFRKSLELARRFQLSLNHYDSTLKDYFSSFGLVDRPLQTVSGDLLWSYPHEDRVFIVLIDSIGHGPAAAIISTALSTILTGLFRMTNSPGVEKLHDRMQDYFDEQYNKLIEGEQVGFDYLFIEYDGTKSTLKYITNQKHLAFFEHDSWQLIAEADKNQVYERSFPKGSQLAAWTDGLKDLQTEDGKKVGNKGIVEFMNDYAGINSTKLKEHLTRFTDKTISKGEQLDDILWFSLQA